MLHVCAEMIMQHEQNLATPHNSSLIGFGLLKSVNLSGKISGNDVGQSGQELGI
jgi:hypothetical protein